MFKKIGLILFLILTALVFPGKIMAEENWITPINLVRAPRFWPEKNSFDEHIKVFETHQVRSTWLPQYEVFKDKNLIKKLKELELKGHEVGILLEVSEDYATDSKVAYLRGEGDYFRPDKVFLSGYNLTERIRLIDTAFKKYHDVFGNYPKSIGAWYLDPFSLQYITDKYGVVAGLVCSDQYVTDKYRLWGQPWGVAFYPSKYNSLIPASSEQEKIDIVLTQWAQRDPGLGYGKTVNDSTYSLQANDYVGFHDLDINYFKKLLQVYLEAGQATMGLEVGEGKERASGFLTEYEKQIKVAKKSGARVANMSEYADWYMAKYDLMSEVRVESEKAIWVNNRDYRAGFLKTKMGLKLVDLRNYGEAGLSSDLVQADKKPFLNRQVKSRVDEVVDRNGYFVESEKIKIERQKISFKDWWKRQKVKVKQALAEMDKGRVWGLRWSKLGKSWIVGFWRQPRQIWGIKTSPLQVGKFEYPFQTLVRFKKVGIK